MDPPGDGSGCRACAAAPATHGDVDQTPVPADEPVQGGGRPVTRDGAFTARQHGGHDPRVLRPAGMADRVDAGVNPVQLTLRHPSRDGRVVQSAFHELVKPHPPVLPGGARGDALIGGWVESSPHSEAQSTHPLSYRRVVHPRSVRQNTATKPHPIATTPRTNRTDFAPSRGVGRFIPA